MPQDSILNKPWFPLGKMLLDIGTREETFSDFNAADSGAKKITEEKLISDY